MSNPCKRSSCVFFFFSSRLIKDLCVGVLIFFVLGGFFSFTLNEIVRIRVNDISVSLAHVIRKVRKIHHKCHETTPDDA